MGLFGQLAINGLADGAVYALMAVGFALILNATRIFHLAHGAVFTFAAYCFYIMVAGMGWSLVVAVPVTMLAAAIFGSLIEIGLYAPLRARGAGPAALLIGSLGLLELCQNLFAIGFGTDIRTVRSGSLSIFRFGPLTITSLHITIAIVAIAAFVLLHSFLTLTKHGNAIRALADNPELAPVVGIDVRRTYVLVMALGSALAAVAAVLLSWDLGLEPDMGFSIVFFSAVAVVIGGAGYLPGTLAGAFALGLVQQLSIWKFDSRWQNGIVFAVVLVFLALRPNGMFGSRLSIRRA